MANTLDQIGTLAQETRMDHEALLSMAIRVGVRQLWRERILGRYLKGQIGRDEAIAGVGIDWVQLAERQHKATLEDLDWALQG